MKLFAHKIATFFICLVLAWTITFITAMLLNSAIKRDDVIDSKNINIKRSTILIMGCSRPECAINDSLLPANYHNVSRSAEPIFYTAIKARHILQKTHNDTIIIEFTNLSIFTMSWAFDDDKAYGKYQECFTKMSAKEHFFIFRNKPLKALKALVSMSPYKILHDHNRIYGQYRFMAGNNLSNTTGKKDVTPLSDTLENENFLALKNLISGFPHTEFILIRSPVHASIQHYANETEYLEKITELTKLNNCVFVDFNKLPPLPDSAFLNIGHLNYKGARIFTPLFIKAIHDLSSGAK